MNFKINLSEKIINVNLINKKNIKHCYIKIIKEDLIQISANNYFNIYDAKKLLNIKKSWIEKSLKNLEKNSINQDEFLYFGKLKKLDEFNIKNLDKFYKDEIKKFIPPLVEKYSKKMNLYPTNIKYRKNKRTWGSCNSKNSLSFNTLLVKYPFEIMEYIVIHELAHIKHKNHSKDFWLLVEKYCPNYKKIEKLFKTFL